ncbi:MAG: NrfD/PsrC family molybdoenzyme membrane anchor subunit [Bdellovibrionota bacterium]
MILGGLSWLHQAKVGLSVTNMSDQVSWGAYIANFTFLVGVAAAAVLLVVPSYIFHRQDFKKIVLLGELLAVSAIIMCLMFVIADLGRPDRFLHIVPFIGRLNFPQSILAWDVVVLNVYLLLNMHIPGYLLWKKYKRQPPNKEKYMPMVYISIIWAVSIHTVTAFLYSGFGSRPFWNSSILAIRFLISAFASGPAILLIIFTIIPKVTDFNIERSVLKTLKAMLAVTIPINLFLFGSELFKEFYTDSTHSASAHYLLFGLHGHAMISPYIWASILFTCIGGTVFLSPSLKKKDTLCVVASVLIVVGVWIEKGMGLVIPGFIPTPLGDLVEYAPSLHEFFVCAGIWATGCFLFTIFSKVAIAIESKVLTI